MLFIPLRLGNYAWYTCMLLRHRRYTSYMCLQSRANAGLKVMFRSNSFCLRRTLLGQQSLLINNTSKLYTFKQIWRHFGLLFLHLSNFWLDFCHELGPPFAIFCSNFFIKECLV